MTRDTFDTLRREADRVEQKNPELAASMRRMAEKHNPEAVRGPVGIERALPPERDDADEPGANG